MKFRSYFGDTKRNLPRKVRALEFFINFHYWQIKVKGKVSFHIYKESIVILPSVSRITLTTKIPKRIKMIVKFKVLL